MRTRTNTLRRPSELNIATLFGIPIYLRISWFIFMAITIFGYATYLTQKTTYITNWTAALTTSTILALLIALGVLIHELAHALTAHLFNLKVHYISMTLWGGITRSDQGRPLSSILISLAGPTINILYALLLGMLESLTTEHNISLGILLASHINLLIALFNLIPVYPLDGAHALEAFITLTSKKRSTGIFYTALIGLLLLPLVILFLVTSENITSPIYLLVTAFLSITLWKNSYPALQRIVTQKSRNYPISAAKLSRKTIRISPETPIQEFLSTWNHHDVPIYQEHDTIYWVDPAVLTSIEHAGPNDDQLLQNLLNKPLKTISHPSAPEYIPYTALHLDLREHFYEYHRKQVPDPIHASEQPIAWMTTTSQKQQRILFYQDFI